MNRSKLFGIEMAVIAILLLLSQIICGGGGGGSEAPPPPAAEVARLARDHEIPHAADKGNVAMDPSQVATASVQSSAIVGALTVPSTTRRAASARPSSR